MTSEAQNGEATPPQNTAPKINPMTFDESALAKLLANRMSESQQTVEEPEPAASSGDEPVAEETQTSETSEDGGETTVDESGEQEAASQSESESDDGVAAEDPSGVQKRINKLVAQKKEAAAKAEALERELADAQRKLEELQQAPPAASVSQSDNPFADIWDEAKLSDEFRKARDLRRWCEDNADGCEVGGKEYSAEDIKAIRRKVEDAIDVHIPMRHQFLSSYKQVKPVAETVYPWWKDRSNPTYSEAQQVLRQMPQLAMFPDHQIAIGDFLEGRRMRLERQKSSKVSKAPVKVAPKQPSAPKASPVRTDAAVTQAKIAKQKFMQTGSSTELAKLLQSTLLK